VHFVLLLALLGDVFITPPRVETLDNGLRICVVEDARQPLFSAQLWVRVGSRHSPPDNRTATALAWGGLREAAGAFTSAGVLRDACYATREIATGSTPNEPAWPERELREALTAFRTALQLRRDGESDDLRQKRFEEGRTFFRSVRPWRDVTRSQPHVFQFIHGFMREALLKNDPYEAEPNIGMLVLPLPDVAPLIEHAERWFAPSAATVFLVGNVDSRRALPLAREILAPLPWRDMPRQPDRDPPADGARRCAGAGIRANEAWLTWVTPPERSFDHAAVNVLLHLLFNSVDGELRGKVSVEWRHAGLERMGLLDLIAWTPPQPLPKDIPGVAAASRPDTDPIALLLAALERVAAAPPGETQLRRARALAAREVLDRRWHPAQWAYHIARREIVDGDLLLMELDLPRVQNMPADAVRSAAAYLLKAPSAIFSGAPGAAREHSPVVQSHYLISSQPMGGTGRVVARIGDAPSYRRTGPKRILEVGRISLLIEPQPASELAWVSWSRRFAVTQRTSLPVPPVPTEWEDRLSCRGMRLAALGQMHQGPLTESTLILGGPTGDALALIELMDKYLREVRGAGTEQLDLTFTGDTSPEFERDLRAVLGAKR
jgi:Peptidase M16 inactive domain